MQKRCFFFRCYVSDALLKISSVGAEACRFIEGQGFLIESPHVEFDSGVSLLFCISLDEMHHGRARTLPTAIGINTDFIHLKEIPPVLEKCFLFTDRTHNAIADDVTPGLCHSYRFSLYARAEFIGKSRLEDVRTTFSVKVVYLTSELIDSLKVLFLSKPYCLFRGSEWLRCPFPLPGH